MREFLWSSLYSLRYIPAMKSKRLLLPSLLFFLAVATAGLADNNVDLQPNDSIQSVLQRQIGQPVELRMKSGEKLGESWRS